MRRVIHEAALLEFNEAIDYYASISPELGVRFYREIERLIRQCPQQYLWGYNRYKRPAGAEAPPASVSR